MRKKVFVSVCAFIMLAVMIGFIGSTEAVAKEVSWKAQTMWAPSITIWRADKYYCDLVNIMGEGDLKVKFYEGGALVTKSGEMFDSVRNNVVQMGGDWPSYWEGKNTAF
ncbi:MAG: hypothetical protein JW884_01530, partial [Deltaproteobacteria bacterium]|nr:hypothetical protein [Deltaproteobacteria bacterium]